MNIDEGKKSRAALKTYFVKNAIPTEGQFAQLIDSGLNQRDDGVVKAAGDPLSIEAAGDATSFKKALNFYSSFADADPAFTILLRPRVNLADPGSGRAGFSISDAAGASRLCIDAATGNIGIGTVTPGERLEVNGRIKAGVLTCGPWPANPGSYAFFGNNTLDQGLTANYALLQETNSGRTFLNSPADIRFRIGNADRMTLAANGNFGVGTVTPGERLEVNGRIKAGVLTCGPWPANPGSYAFFGNNTLDHAVAANYALLQETNSGRTFLNSPADIRFRIGNVDRMMLTNGGMVAIGTTSPHRTLHVEGSEIHSGGSSGGFSFANRQTGSFVLDGANGQRWVWYAANNVARLWSAGDRLWVTAGGQLTVTGGVIVQQSHTIKLGIPTGTYGNDGIRGEPNLWLDASGTVFIKQGFQARGMDVAERFPAVEPLAPGTVVVFDEEAGGIRRCDAVADRRVVGIVSGEAAFILGIEEAEVPVALCGRLRCRVDADVLPIRAGDLLTTSATPGCAQRAADPAACAGAIIGKALTSLAGGRGEVLVLAHVR